MDNTKKTKKQEELYEMLSENYPYGSSQDFLYRGLAFIGGTSLFFSIFAACVYDFINGGNAYWCGIVYLTLCSFLIKAGYNSFVSTLSCRLAKNKKVEKLYSKLEDLTSTPYHSYIIEAISKEKSPKKFYEVFTNKKAIEKVKEKTNKINWDKPRILSIFDLKTKEEIKPKNFDYEEEINNFIKYTLKDTPGVLDKSPKKIYNLIKNAKTPEEKIKLLVQNMRYYLSERERAEALINLESCLNDEYFIAKYLSMDNKIVAKIWDRDPKKDMGKGNEFFCCTMPEKGVDYILDPGISMLDFYRDGERKARAILVATKNKKKKCLLVDSIEGTDRILDNFQQPISKFIINSIMKYGYESGFDYIQFNKNSFSNFYKKILSSLDYSTSSSMLKPMFKDNSGFLSFYLEAFSSPTNAMLSLFGLQKLFGYKVKGSRINLKSNIEFENLKPKHIKDVMFIEKRSFYVNVRQGEFDLLETLKYKEHIGVIAQEEIPIGYALGAPLEFYGNKNPEKAVKELGIKDEHYGFNDSFYLESIAVLPEKRGKNIGSLLFSNMLKFAKEKGYKRFVGFAYKNGWNLAKKFNAKIISEIKGFYDDGSDAKYYEIPLE